MSFPTATTATTPQRDALRRALHTSLQDVLMEVAIDAQQIRPPLGAAAAAAPTAAARPPVAPPPVLGTTALSAAAAAARLPTPVLAACQPSALAQSLGLSTPAAPPAAVSPFGGLGSQDLLSVAAAAAAESRLLDQARAALIQQRISQEKKRMMIENSYMNLLRSEMNKGTSTSSPTGGLTPAAAAATSLMTKTLPAAFLGAPAATTTIAPSAAAAAAVAPPKQLTGQNNANALEALGSSLRSKTDPYIDVSKMKDPDPQDTSLRRTRGGVAEPFPEKLHRMLKEVEKEGKTDIVSFYSHGRAFGVHDIDRFVSEIMPKYFKQSKWNSFARQLNLYGFLRITTGPDAGGYYHELFLRGRPNLSYHMRRVGVPQGEDRRKLKAKNNIPEPDFYSMSVVSA